MRVRLGFVLPLMILATPAMAAMQLSYGDWAKETPHERELVIAALVEGLTGIPHSDTLGTWTKHFAKCIADKGMTSTDLISGIDGMVTSTTGYGPGSKLLVTLTHYLELQCGKPEGLPSGM